MFEIFAKAVHAQFVQMCERELYIINGEGVFDRYLSAFPAGTNPIFRQRTEHDCQCCKQFITRLGITVSLKDGKLTTVWGDLDLPEPYKTVAEAMDDYVRSRPIVSVFRTKELHYGLNHNYDKVTNQRYNHFYGDVSAKHYTQDVGTKLGEMDAAYQVLKRGLEEIRLSHINDVLNLIENNNLYRGEEHKPAILGFEKLLRGFNGLDNYIWEHLRHPAARFRNTVIGTLLVDLAEGKELDAAVRAFETKVAPTNYKRTTSVITQRMVEDAVGKLNELGLGGAIYRRYARPSDISVNDVLFVDNSVKLKDSVTSLLESSIKKSTPDLKHAVVTHPVEFIESILPGASSVELLIENRHTGNFVSLTGSDGPERLFKWNNNFAWSYDGDVTDSVKARVKAAGGKIDCKLRVSLSWYNIDDLDLHACTPREERIYFGNKMGILDVDMNAHSLVRNPVENLAFQTLQNGCYSVWVNQFRRRETTDFGFAIEVECNGVLNQYNYSKALRDKEDVPCFRLTVKGGELVKIETDLPGGNVSQEKWGVKTETLVPVSLITYSPNHWQGQSVGAKHLIFALKGCNNPEPTRGIYNEYLRGDLEKHRKVFEVLGAKTKCQPTGDQVSGVGFTAARGDTVTAVVDGRRSYNIIF